MGYMHVPLAELRPEMMILKRGMFGINDSWTLSGLFQVRDRWKHDFRGVLPMGAGSAGEWLNIIIPTYLPITTLTACLPTYNYLDCLPTYL